MFDSILSTQEENKEYFLKIKFLMNEFFEHIDFLIENNINVQQEIKKYLNNFTPKIVNLIFKNKNDSIIKYMNNSIFIKLLSDLSKNKIKNFKKILTPKIKNNCLNQIDSIIQNINESSPPFKQNLEKIINYNKNNLNDSTERFNNSVEKELKVKFSNGGEKNKNDNLDEYKIILAYKYASENNYQLNEKQIDVLFKDKNLNIDLIKKICENLKLDNKICTQIYENCFNEIKRMQKILLVEKLQKDQKLNQFFEDNANNIQEFENRFNKNLEQYEHSNNIFLDSKEKQIVIENKKKQEKSIEFFIGNKRNQDDISLLKKNRIYKKIFNRVFVYKKSSIFTKNKDIKMLILVYKFVSENCLNLLEEQKQQLFNNTKLTTKKLDKIFNQYKIDERVKGNIIKDYKIYTRNKKEQLLLKLENSNQKLDKKQKKQMKKKIDDLSEILKEFNDKSFVRDVRA